MEEEKENKINEEIGENNSEEKVKVEREELVEEQKENPEKELKKEEKKSENKNLTEKIKKKTISFLKNKYNLAFLVVLFLALLIRLKYIGQESLWNDAAQHLWYAVKVLQEPSFFFGNSYLTGDYFLIQTLTAIVYLFTKNIFLAGKIVAIPFGLLGIIFIYLLGSELKNKFLGLISAALLGFHHLFWFYGVRPLADGPLVTMVIMTLYFVIKLEKKKTFIWGVLTMLSFSSMMLVKKQGVLLFLAFLVYLVLFKRKEVIKNKALLICWSAPLFFIVLASLVSGRNLLYELLNRVIVGYGLQYTGLNAIRHFEWIFSWYLLVPMMMGGVLVLFYKKKEFYLPILFFIIYLVYFELGVGTPEDRYIMPLLPVGIISASFAFDEVRNYLSYIIKKKMIVRFLMICFVIFVCWHFYNLGDPLIYQKSFSYRGHQEAGQWIRENVLEDDIVFAGSPRMVRTFTEREYAGPNESLYKGKIINFDYGGDSLWYLRAPKYRNNKTAFEKDLEKLSKESNVYLEIDIWEYTQPKWYFPITQESINTFIDLGFELVYVVEREVQTQQGLQKMPVIFIFKKEKTNSI